MVLVVITHTVMNIHQGKESILFALNEANQKKKKTSAFKKQSKFKILRVFSF